MKLSIVTTPVSKKKLIQIKCAYHENTLPASMPSRKFHKPSGSWRAPIVRLNIEYLRANRDKFEGTEEFWDVLNSHKPPMKSSGFPSEYPFKTTPMPHQGECIKKLYPQPFSAIFADIGTGKTKMAIDMATCRFYEARIKRVLVICLLSIKNNWKDEIAIHCPVGATSVHLLETSKAGQNRFRRFMQEDGFQWLVVGVESLSAGKATSLCEEYVNSETMVIIDESDSIKTHNAARTERAISLGENAKYRMIMTGTPITQGIIDFYSQFEFLHKDIIGIGDFYSFRNRYAIMGGYEDKNIIGYQRTEELLDTVAPYIYQVRKRDVLKDLPPSTYQEYRVPMSGEQKAIYKELKAKLKVTIDSNILTVKSVINLMQRFSEITGGFYSYVDQEAMEEIAIDERAKIKYKKAYLKSNPKGKELMRFIESLPHDEPLIVWAVTKMEIAWLVENIGKVYGYDQIAQMHGEISVEDRNTGLKEFQAGKKRFIVGNQSVGGIGLNMTKAAIMAYFSNDFSLRRRIQSEGRIERIGQLRPMVYVDFICEASIDGYVVQALKDKSDFAETIRKAFDSGSLEDLV